MWRLVSASSWLPHGSLHVLQEWTGEACLGDAILSTFYQLPGAKWMVTTLGARGSVLLERPDPTTAPPGAGGAPAKVAVLEELLQAALPTEAHREDRQQQQPLEQQKPWMEPAAAAASGGAASTGNGSASGLGANEPPVDTNLGSTRPACVSSSGVHIWEGIVSEQQPCRLRLQRGGTLGSGDGQEVAERRAAAAQAAAAANADAGGAGRYAGTSSLAGEAAEELVAGVLLAQAAKLPGVSNSNSLEGRTRPHTPPPPHTPIHTHMQAQSCRQADKHCQLGQACVR